MGLKLHQSAANGRDLTRGFTLIELLLVLFIAGILLGLVAIKAAPRPEQALQDEAQRIASLLQLARDEAILRNRPIAFEADTEHYRFLVLDEQQWHPIKQDTTLRERSFQVAPMTASINTTSTQNGPMRIVFGREPVDKPFVLTLSSGSVRVSIQADGVGHFSVE